MRVRNTPRTTNDLADEELVSRYQAGHQDALDQLLARYRRFARSKTRSYFLVGAGADDIEQEAMIGLYKAARDFQADRLVCFRAFADLCITRQIITAIKAVHAGNTHFPKRIEARLLERKQRDGLSAREIEILELLSKGLTNKTIGQALGISKFTVRNHVNRILEKLEVCDRTEASTVAIEQGILPTFH